jgi:hypothetical protein
MNFKKAVVKTPNLRNSWKPGLQALRAEDRPHIKADDTRRLSGSADVDTALQGLEPNANRWDFAIGYRHTNRIDEFIYWVETHTGSDNQIKVVLKKLAWLKGWLKAGGKNLAPFECDFLWVSSGHTFFTNGSKQVKELAQKGLIYSGSRLSIRNEGPS